MPHLRIDYSANLPAAVAWPALFTDLHGVLRDVAEVDVGNCKSRAYRAEHYRVGDGKSAEAFVHLELQLLEGRPPELLGELGNQALGCLERHCCRDDSAQPLQLTVVVGELVRERYFKRASG